MYRSGAADRQSRLDPGAAGTIIVTPVDRAVCVMTGAGARTLEAAALIGVGTTILLVSQTDAVTVSGNYLNDGDWVLMSVVLDGSGAHTWSALSNSTAHIVDVTVPLLDARVFDAPTTLLPAGAGATDDMGMNTGTYGTTNPTMNSLDVGGGGEAFNARIQIQVPTNYVQGDVLTLEVNVTEVVACVTSATLDLTCYRTAAPTVDICATAVQSIVGATATDYDFTLTSTGILPGEILDVVLTTTLTAAAADRGDYDINEIKLAS